MIWETIDNYDDLSERAATILLAAIAANPRIVLGLPTGRTPVGMYEHVVEHCGRERHCFRDVTTFNLDEYVGIDRAHPGSYFTFMRENLFDHVDVDSSRTNIPDGTAPDLTAECSRYERSIAEVGGLGLTFLGLGRNGHIGFNEPGTPFDARTRVVQLTESTRIANAALFEDGHVPHEAITMGIGTILESAAIVLLVAGHGKEAAVAELRSGEVNEAFPASALWKHPNVRVLTAV
ncbi:MAG TPA: glucosamine-6-phosphate deaminase [Thermoanaerobaculia bacterium]|nr:glucosamine-6-phosphate deaminase [Thermoanaerobaculia bacterium]